MSLILHYCVVTLSNLIHSQNKESDGEGEALCVDQVSETFKELDLRYNYVKLQVVSR